VYNPYKRINFSDSLKIIPGSASPYQPSSGDLMLQVPNDAADGEIAKVSVGCLQANPCFRFDFTSMRAGCASTKANCVFNITGLAWDDDAQTEVVVGSQMSSIRACPRQHNCKLGTISADVMGRLFNLTGLVIDVTAHNTPQKWWADDIAMSWTDKSCDANVCRSNIKDAYPQRGLGEGLTQMVKVVHP
jgi:hypothetical protein